MSTGPSIRRRLILALAGVSLFTLLTVGVVFYIFLGDYVIDRQRDLLLDQAVEVAEQVEGVSENLPLAIAGTRGRVMLTRLLLADLRVLPSGSGIVVFSDRKVIAKVGSLPAEAESGERLEKLRAQAEELGTDEPASAVLEAELTEEKGRVAAIMAVAPIALPDGQTGLAVVTLARSDAFVYRGGIIRTLLVAGAVAVGLAVLVGSGLGSWMTRPLRRLSTAARGMAGGSYQEPVTGGYPGEIQELADSLETMRQEVRHSEDSLRGFVASAAHELRTPLTSIQGFSQALLDGTAATKSERSRSAAAIYRESTRLRRLVDTLLTLSRYDSHEFEPNLSEVSVDELVREEVERLVEVGMADRAKVSVKIDGETRALTDGDMLRQVIANLLHNAVQYGEEGPVQVYLQGLDGGLTLEVANGGRPLSAEEKARIFSRFYRGRGGRQSEGFGLGLALVWEICGLLGGRVELVEGDSLTRFRVTLPLDAGAGTGRRGGK